MAGCYDRSWRFVGGSKARGTRSPFRLGTEGLLQPFKSTYPAHLTDVMESVPSTKSDLLRGFLVNIPPPPVGGNRTLTVRQSEELIEKLEKENFDLKMRLWLQEQDKTLRHGGPNGDEMNHTIEVIVQLKAESDSLRNELSSKENLLQDALERAEKYAVDLKDFQEKVVELQEQIKSVSNVSSQNECVLLKDENRNLEREIANLRNALTESQQQVQQAEEKIEELTVERQALEEKISRRSMAIQGLVHKYHKEAEMIPKEMRPIVQGAVQAAKERNEEEMNAAILQLKESLANIMPMSIEEDTEQKENNDPLRKKKSSQQLGNYTFGESNQSERQSDSKTNFVHASKEHSINEDRSLNQSSESIDNYASNSVENENFEKIVALLQENETLKAENEEKSLTIKDLNSNYAELERRTIQLQSDLIEAVTKVRRLEERIKDEKSKNPSSSPKLNAIAQTDIQGHVTQNPQSDDFLQSENVEDLKEEILRMQLLVEKKDKDLSDIEQELTDVQSQLERMNYQKDNTLTDVEETTERHDLHERLALSCQVNQELMSHLRKLEEFMEDLLHNRNMDSSSIENISEASDVFTKLTTCLNETKQLSSMLSGHLTFCENSKLFDGDVSQFGSHSHTEDQSHLSHNTTDTLPTSQGMKNFLLEPPKTAVGTGKRRLSFSTLHNSAHIDHENSIFLGTSNNEDLILLLNDNGDPKDVVIRNSSQRDPTTDLWAKEKPNIDQWCGMKYVRNRCPSSDSDIWSEPDRDVSMKRIGIDVQMSPVSQKSPRRSRLRDKRTTEELSSQKYESSSSAVKSHSWLKRRKSSDTLRSSFICKKCASPVKEDIAEKDRLHKVVNDLSIKCSKQENELDDVKGTLEGKIHLIETLNDEKEELSSTINQLKKELKVLQDKEKELTIKTSKSIHRLTKVSNENDQLRNAIQELEFKSSETDSTCEQLKAELRETRKRLENLDLKCSQYESDLSSNSQTLGEYKEKCSNLEKEKSYLLREIEIFQSTKEMLLQSIQERNKDINDLKAKLEEKSQSVTFLQTQYDELEIKNSELLKEKENKEHELKENLTKSQKSLEILRQNYEKETTNSSKVRENFVKSVLSVKKAFLSNLQYLANVSKEFWGSEEESFKDIDDFVSSMISEADSDKIEELFAGIQSIHTKFEQTIDYLSEQLSSVSYLQEQVELGNKEIQSLKTQNSQLNTHLKTLQLTDKENQAEIKDSRSKVNILQQDLDNAHNDIKDLKNLVKTQQMQVEYIEQSLQNREKSLEESKIQTSSSESQLNNVKQQIKKDQQLLQSKDEEIDNLQKKILSLHTQLDEVMSQKMMIESQPKVSPNKISQEKRSEYDPSEVASNASAKSVSSERDGSMNGSIADLSRTSSVESIQRTVSVVENDSDMVKRKIKSLKSKLGIAEKRIEILENEKASLRKQISQQDISSIESDEITSLRKSISDLKDKLKEKTATNRELKKDVFKTCNSLLEKQKEVDSLKHKISEGKKLADEDRSKSENNLSSGFSDPVQADMETNIKMLKNNKWELIQAIMAKQKQFYEHKNIHLGHFEKFKNFIEKKVRSLAMTKADSDPLMNSFASDGNGYTEKCDRALKSLTIELEIDVECLQSLNIFLRRFFIPVVLQNCEQCSKHIESSTSPVKKSPSTEGGQNLSKYATEKNLRLSDVVETTGCLDESPHDRLISRASVLANKIDLIEDLLKSANALLENLKDSCCSSVEETPNKIHAAKSLLMKIYDAISIQREKLDEMFHLNSVLKSLGLFEAHVVLSRSKQDVSDRESLSEEAIPISRSGSLSPTHFEDPSQFRGQLDRSKNQSNSKTERKDNQSNVAGGSRDSIFQRSHVSSPDQGIESDRNDSSAPEQGEREDFRSNASRIAKTMQKQWTSERQLSSSSLGSFMDNFAKLQVSDHYQPSDRGDSLHSIGLLEHYELLKKEVHESLVGIKAVLSRTEDGLQHVLKYSSPRKSLEYSTFKAIRDKSEDIKVCLMEASKLVETFWIAPCPDSELLNKLIQQNEENQDKLKFLEESKMKQETYFKDAMYRLKQQEILKLNMEKKISKKLVKTKNVIRQAEAKLLEQGSQQLLIPKYPTDEPSCQI